MQPLSENEFEQLSAWHDGELDPAEAEVVARKVAHEPAWSEANRQMLALEKVLDRDPAPGVPDDLATRICTAARQAPREHRILRLARWLAPAAAAAAVLLVLTVFHQPHSQDPGQQLAGQALPEEFVREGIDVFGGLDNGLTPQVRLSRELNDQTPRLFVLVPGEPPQAWDDLSEAQKQQLRRRALAFLKLTPRQQKQVLADYEQLANTAQRQDAWRARWLGAVVESFTPEERSRLKTLAPGERARLFIQRRNELIQNGTLQPPAGR